MEKRNGRPREYNISPAPGYKSEELGFRAAWLAELRERVIDQISWLPPNALNYVSGDTKLSIARLARHLAWAEATWFGKAGGPDPAADLAELLSVDALSGFSADPVPADSAEPLVAAIRRIGEEVAEPTLRAASDIDSVVLEDGTTMRGIVMHLECHWLYHSGHIGLLAFECGYDYTWRANRPYAPNPPGPR